MTTPQYTFKQHRFSDAEMLWLTEVAQSPSFSPRRALVALRERLPAGFDAGHLDMRFYVNGQLTPLGLWVVDPNREIFCTMDRALHAIRERIIKNPPS